MGIPIVSGASADLLTIDATSKAARVTLYGPDGAPLVYTSTNDRFAADIRVKQTATTGAGAVVWAIRNKTSGRTIYIDKIILHLAQAGTGAATEMQYEFIKYTGVTALTSATAVTPLLKRTSIANADLDVGVLDTGITMTNGSAGAAFWNAYMQRVTHSATASADSTGAPWVFDFGNFPIELAQNEALALRNVVTAVVGDIVSGTCIGYG